MISFAANDVGLKVEQWCVSPTVYLDHWAWRRISASTSLSTRFSNALKLSGGTLVLSWLNIAEFSKVDPKQGSQADALLSLILPQVFLLNPDFFKVISEEDTILAGGKPTAPHADLEMLKFLIKHSLRTPNSLQVLSPGNIFRLVALPSVASHFEAFADIVINHVELVRQDYEKNREFGLAVDRIPSGPSIQRGTRFLSRELLRTVLKDRALIFDRNHAIDVCHAVTPVAYCDFVLLDGHWDTQVKRAQKRIAAGGLTFPIAKVFSERANGIERFLGELEAAAPKSAI